MIIPKNIEIIRDSQFKPVSSKQDFQDGQDNSLKFRQDKQDFQDGQDNSLKFQTG